MKNFTYNNFPLLLLFVLTIILRQFDRSMAFFVGILGFLTWTHYSKENLIEKRTKATFIVTLGMLILPYILFGISSLIEKGWQIIIG